jgi:hypothetical protein
MGGLKINIGKFLIFVLNNCQNGAESLENSALKTTKDRQEKSKILLNIYLLISIEEETEMI